MDQCTRSSLPLAQTTQHRQEVGYLPPCEALGSYMGYVGSLCNQVEKHVKMAQDIACCDATILAICLEDSFACSVSKELVVLKELV